MTGLSGRLCRWMLGGLVPGLAVALAIGPQDPADAAVAPSLTPSSLVAAPSAIARRVAAMSPSQKAGQLLMIDASTSGSGLPTSAIRRYRFGSVLLMGNTGASIAAIHRVTAQLQSAAVPTGSLLISTDQEGGYVQRLGAPGFSTIPTALTQGGMGAARLRAAAHIWGSQLKRAGVNLDLAPVLDVVTHPSSNPPIGQWKREYGSTPSRVVVGSQAFAAGMTGAGVAVCGKHFPGLGFVHANTDTSNGVVDTTIGPTSPYLAPFRQAVRSGFPFIMMSTAVYRLLDPTAPAAFSHKIVTGLLRNEMGFRGVVVSDSLDAVQVAGASAAARALRFIRAGGDLIVTTRLSTAIQMHDALVSEQSHPGFRALVDAAVTRILVAKANLALKPYMVGGHVVSGWSQELGQPISPESRSIGYGVVGYYQRFPWAIALLHSRYGTFSSRGRILAGWKASTRGWPTSNVTNAVVGGTHGQLQTFRRSSTSTDYAFLPTSSSVVIWRNGNPG